LLYISGTLAATFHQAVLALAWPSSKSAEVAAFDPEAVALAPHPEHEKWTSLPMSESEGLPDSPLVQDLYERTALLATCCKLLTS
jgi:hypothetical protein